MAKSVKDGSGQVIAAGDIVSFSYGIPPVGVDAKVVDINGTLWCLTPGHNPDRCKLSQLKGYVGDFYKLSRREALKLNLKERGNG